MVVASPELMKSVYPEYHAITVQQLSDFEALAGEWEALLAQAQEQNIAVDHTWLSTWLQHFPPEKLCIVLIWDQYGKLVAAAPFKINRSPSGLFRRSLRHLQFIGTDPDVYDGIRIIMTPEANEDWVIREIVQQLMQHATDWDVLDLRYGLSAEQWACFAKHLKAYGVESEFQQSMAAYAFPLPTTVAAYEQGRKRNLKKSVNRRLNRLREDFPDQPLSFEILPPGERFDRELSDFIQNHREYWQAHGCRSDFNRFRNLPVFYHSLYSHYHPRFLFSILKVGETTLGYQLSLVQGNTLLTFMTSYQTAYGKYCPGTLQIEKLIQYAIESGLTEFNLGRGDEPYKEQWSPQPIPLFNLIAYRTRWAKLRVAADDWLRRLKPKRRSLIHE